VETAARLRLEEHVPEANVGMGHIPASYFDGRRAGFSQTRPGRPGRVAGHRPARGRRAPVPPLRVGPEVRPRPPGRSRARRLRPAARRVASGPFP
jgi:hypothetical protein